MKKLILIFLLCCNYCFAQNYEYGKAFLFNFRSQQDENNFVISSGILILHGSFKATRDILRENYPYFQAVFPRSNPNFWDGSISHQFIPNTFAARTYMRWSKDGWHLFDTGANLTMYAVIVIPLTDFGNIRKIPAWNLIARGVWNVGMRSIGYNFTDRYIYHHY